MGDKEARWEFPSGHIEGNDSAVATAIREWKEETGAKFPKSAEQVGTWASEDGEFQGFVFRVASEDGIEFGLPDGKEISAVAWWDIDDLDDDKVREKVKEGLDRAEPILEQAQKAKWEDYHHHTDKIVDHYTPEIKDALAGVLEGETVRAAIRASYQATKSTSPGSDNTPKYERQLAALTGLSAAGNAQSILSAAQTLSGPLEAVLRELYGDAILQGAHEAGAALNLPESYWKDWTPGQSSASAQLADGGLQRLLDTAGVRVRGIVETEIHRIATAIEEGLRNNQTMPEITAAVNAIVNDSKRAAMIAETEFARASTAARRATYVRNGVPQVGWLHQPGACHRCMENAAASPISINASWPSGDVPVHPNCRCVEVPVVNVPGREP